MDVDGAGVEEVAVFEGLLRPLAAKEWTGSTNSVGPKMDNVTVERRAKRSRFEARAGSKFFTD
jgi:hypothetical protein